MSMVLVYVRFPIYKVGTIAESSRQSSEDFSADKQEYEAYLGNLSSTQKTLKLQYFSFLSYSLCLAFSLRLKEAQLQNKKKLRNINHTN